MVEKEGSSEERGPDIPVGIVELQVPLLKARHFDPESGRLRSGLRHLRERLSSDPKAKQWFDESSNEVEKGKKNIRVYATVGAVIFLIGVGVEIGRKGHDIKKIKELIDKKNSPKGKLP